MLDLEPMVFVLYIIPGFIATRVRDLVVPRKHDKDLGYLAETIIASAGIILSVYFVYWLLGLVVEPAFRLPDNPLSVSEADDLWALLVLSSLFSVPFGILWSRFLLSKWRVNVIKKFTGVKMGPYQTVWPHFAKNVRGKWIKVILTDGTKYGGWMSEYVIENDSPDIVLSDAGILGDDGYFQEGALIGDVYIKLDAVISIEVLT